MELAALALSDSTDPSLPARALAAVDAACRRHDGRSPSAHDGTILHPYREAIEARAPDELARGRDMTVTDAAAALIEHPEPYAG